MRLSQEDREKRALTILQQLKGMEIAEAQNLLQWCSDYLLKQPVGEWVEKTES